MVLYDTGKQIEANNINKVVIPSVALSQSEIPSKFIIGQGTMCCNCEEKLNQMLQKQNTLDFNQKRLEKKIDQILYLVKEMPKHLNVATTITTEVSEDVENFFPLKTDSNLEELENRLQNPQFKQQMVNKLHKFHIKLVKITPLFFQKALLLQRVNLGKGLSVAFKSIFNDELIFQYNWAGTQGKKSINNFQLIIKTLYGKLCYMYIYIHNYVLVYSQ